MNSLFNELKRRNIVRVSVAYFVGAWLVLQIFEVVSSISDWPPKYSQYLLIVLVAGIPVVAIAGWFYESREDVQVRRVREVEEALKTELGFAEFFQAQLQFVAERARLLMIKAESRANRLYAIGTILTVISVFAPVASVLIYLNLDPLPSDLIETVNELRSPDGDFPDGLVISASKDWRVLLSGISFGLLFLAAAGALFAQNGRQMNTMLRLGRDVDYFDAVVSAAEIRRKAEEEELDDPMRKLVDEVVSNLLYRETQDLQNVVEASDRDKIDAVGQLKELTTSIKELKP